MTAPRRRKSRKPTPSGKPPATAPWTAYGAAKAPIESAGLAPAAYGRAVRRLARKMGV